MTEEILTRKTCEEILMRARTNPEEFTDIYSLESLTHASIDLYVMDELKQDEMTGEQYVEYVKEHWREINAEFGMDVIEPVN